jgi:hypothetical protein
MIQIAYFNGKRSALYAEDPVELDAKIDQNRKDFELDLYGKFTVHEFEALIEAPEDEVDI